MRSFIRTPLSGLLARSRETSVEILARSPAGGFDGCDARANLCAARASFFRGWQISIEQILWQPRETAKSAKRYPKKNFELLNTRQ
jgi:hypothetical protein